MPQPYEPSNGGASPDNDPFDSIYDLSALQRQTTAQQLAPTIFQPVSRISVPLNDTAATPELTGLVTGLVQTARSLFRMAQPVCPAAAIARSFVAERRVNPTASGQQPAAGILVEPCNVAGTPLAITLLGGKCVSFEDPHGRGCVRLSLSASGRMTDIAPAYSSEGFLAAAHHAVAVKESFPDASSHFGAQMVVGLETIAEHYPELKQPRDEIVRTCYEVEGGVNGATVRADYKVGSNTVSFILERVGNGTLQMRVNPIKGHPSRR